MQPYSYLMYVFFSATGCVVFYIISTQFLHMIEPSA